MERIADDIPPLDVDDPTGDAELLVLGWGSTYGVIRTAARRARDAGKKVATAHLVAPEPPAREHRGGGAAPTARC